MTPRVRSLLLGSVLALTLIAPVRGQAVPWWNRAVFYQAFVRSFADSRSGPLAGDGIGDFQGMIERLDYLNDGDPATTTDLGVTALWLMPVMASPSYHGYDVVDYYALNPQYGTRDDFRRLVRECHRRGIRVVVDMVLNHTSRRHPWFSDHAERYVWRPAGGSRVVEGRTVWHGGPDSLYYGYFGGGMPDLDYRNPDVTAAVYDVVRFWLDTMDVDGLRLDAIRHLVEDGDQIQNTPETHAWLKDFRRFYKQIDPGAVTIGEIWDATENVVPYVGDELDLAFEFDLAGATLAAADTGLAAPLREQALKAWRAYPPGQYATFLANHDQDRSAATLGDDPAKNRLAAGLLLTSPGVPFVYYGEEIGLAARRPDPQVRRPMPWTGGPHAGFSTAAPWQAPDTTFRHRNVAAQQADPGSLLSTYRRLVHLRAMHPALREGDYVPIDASDPRVYAFLRRTAAETVLVVANLSAEPVRGARLSVEAGLPAARLRATELLEGARVRAPRPDASGGFHGYRPLRVLAPQTVYAIRLEAAGR